jgi:hypothetical protein
MENLLILRVMMSERLAREQYFSPHMIAEGGNGRERVGDEP